MPRDWEEVRITVIRPGPIPTSSPCGNTIPDDDQLTVSLPAGARYAILSLILIHAPVSLRADGFCFRLSQVCGSSSASVFGKGRDLQPSL